MTPLGRPDAPHYVGLRWYDVHYLWPAFKTDLRGDVRAREAFAAHCLAAPAWRALGEKAMRDAIAKLR